ncbi:hypothetical protein ABUW04_20305 [Streptacidiphilus sp. N1-10]|uniref:Sugar ABC transporter substrate-binding protein n=1 Tax=Streptacidiphilus jeojiensis TaxID=3229225 RepID=A0ABV6XQS1_9ACTN
MRKTALTFRSGRSTRSAGSTGPLGRRAAAPVALAAVVAMALSACSSSSTGTGGSAGSSGSAPAAGGTATATANVAKLTEALSSYPVPTATLSGVSALKGKTVYYIPITQQAAQFTVTGTALKQALASVGVNLQICNGGSNPSTIAACVNQAVGAGAGAIVTDSIPYALAGNALDAARAKKIPVLVTDQIADSAHPADSTLGYIEGAGSAQLVAIADWIIADSNGKAKVVLNESTDSPSTVAYVTKAQEEFKQLCPDCSVTVNKISSANFSLIASSTSSTVLRTPGVQYVVSEFDQYLQVTQGGVQQSGKAASVKGVSSAAGTAGLTQLKSKNFLYVDAGQASAYQGWATADAALRLMLGQTLPDYTIPMRLFTRDNVGSITIDSADEASGAWFGPTDFTSKFKTLWGAA